MMYIYFVLKFFVLISEFDLLCTNNAHAGHEKYYATM